MNSVNIIGRLGRDPEVRFSQSGSAIVGIRLGISERFKGSDGEWQDRTVWTDVKMFGKRGEAFAAHHGRGSLAALSGRLGFDEWEDKQSGQKRSKLYVIATDWEFVGDKPRDAEPDPWGHGGRGTVRKRSEGQASRGQVRDEEPF